MKKLPHLDKAIADIVKDDRLSEEQWKRLDGKLTETALKAAAAFLRPLQKPQS